MIKKILKFVKIWKFLFSIKFLTKNFAVLPDEITKAEFHKTTQMTQNQLNLTQPPRLGGHGGPFGGRRCWGCISAGCCYPKENIKSCNVL